MSFPGLPRPSRCCLIGPCAQALPGPDQTCVIELAQPHAEATSQPTRQGQQSCAKCDAVVDVQTR